MPGDKYEHLRSGEETNELALIKDLIRDLPDDYVDNGITLESIMAEEKYSAVTAPPSKKADAPERVVFDFDAFEEEFEEALAAASAQPVFAREEATVPPKPSKQKPMSVNASATPVGVAPAPVHTPAAAPPEKASGVTQSVPAPAAQEGGLPDFVFDETFASAFSRPSASGTEDAGYEEDTLSEDESDGFAAPRRSIGDFLRSFKAHIRKPLPPVETLPEQAYKRVSPYAGSLRARTLAAFVLALPLFVVALAPLLGISLPDWLVITRRPYMYLLITGGLQTLIMLCAVDVVARGFSDLFHLRPGPETLVTISGVATLLHVLTLIIDIPAFREFVGFTPYTTVCGISFFFTLWASFYQYNGYRHTYKAAKEVADDRALLITLEEELWDGVSGYTKRTGSLEGFVSRTETPDISRRFSSLLAPLLMVASLVFAVAASAGQGRANYFFWAWSAISLAAAPFHALFVFSLPFSRVARRLCVKGGAIAGWTAARELWGGEFIAAHDEDFFPPEMVSLNGLKVFGGFTFDQVTLYSAALLKESGSSLFAAMRGIIKGQEDKLPVVSHVEHHETGGLSGESGRDRILMGTADFMLHSGIRLPKNLIMKKAVYVTVNLELAGIFAINYIPSASVEGAIDKLRRHGVTTLMAVRDFNITPKLLEDRYRIEPDTLEYPTIEDRLALSDPERDAYEQPGAFVTRDGISPMAECVVGARRLRRVARVNLFFYIICTLASVFAMFYFTRTGTSQAAASILPGNVLLYFLLWWLPVWICSSAAHRY